MKILKYFLISLIFTVSVNFLGESVLKPIPSLKPYDYLSPRFQQLAAAVYYHPESFTKEELKIYDEILGLQNIKKFDYTIVDPIKDNLNKEKLIEYKSEFFKLWLKGYKNHPKKYIDVVLNLSVSYWYPYNFADVIYFGNYYGNMYTDEKNWFMADKSNDSNNKKDILLDEGWSQNSKNLDLSNITYLYIFWFEELDNYPVLSTLFRPGVYTISLIIIFMISILKKNKKIMPLILLIFSIILTCIYSPLVNYFRYSYIFITLIPLVYPILKIRNSD